MDLFHSTPLPASRITASVLIEDLPSLVADSVVIWSCSDQSARAPLLAPDRLDSAVILNQRGRGTNYFAPGSAPAASLGAKRALAGAPRPPPV